MTIENTSVGLLIMIVMSFIYVKFWRMIAEYVGRQLGIGKFIVGLFDRRYKKRVKALEQIMQNSELDSIQLKKVTIDNYNDLMSIGLHEEQKKYTSSIEKSLADAYIYGDNVHPFAIYKNNYLIGFIMTRYNLGHDNHLIWQFMIDKKYQNKGYAKKSILKTIYWIIKQNNCSNIVTTVLDDNDKIKQIYISLGFKQIGETLDGETDYILNIDEFCGNER